MFLGAAGSSKSPVPASASSPVSEVNETLVNETLTIADTNEDEDGLAEEQPSKQRNQSTPKQDELCKQINIENEILVVLYKKKELNQLTESDRGEIKTRKETLEKLKRKLRELQLNRRRSIKYRNERKRKLDALDEATRKKITGKGTPIPGRPHKHDNTELIEAICRIAIPGSAAHERRRNEVIRTVKSLDQLTEALNQEGYDLKRSSVYLHLLPKKSRTIEGKRHIHTAPVKLFKSQNSKHAAHVSTKFARSSIKSLEEIATILGPEEVIFHSMDDKAKVPIGITAAKKQTPLLMHMEYQVTLPDHDFVVGSKHKLLPSVIGDMKVVKNKDLTNDGVTYSGPTYIAIRSAKHSGSSALNHLRDMNRARSLPEFTESFQNRQSQEKKVMIVTVDGGPDENPRYSNNISCAIEYFCEHDLDAYFLATNAPGRSAFNRVERRMSNLSKELSGVILPHDHFGTHLDNNNKTIDEELELRNFEYAAEILAELWSKLVIDGHPVVAEFINEEPLEITITKSEEWKAKHVRESQYFLQIVKCTDQACCTPFQSSYLKIMKDRFLPPPVPVVYSQNGVIEWAKDDKEASYLLLFQNIALNASLMPKHAITKFPKGIPYDYSCPSTKDNLADSICKHCGLYFGSIKSRQYHSAFCRTKDSLPVGNRTEARKVRPQRVAARRQNELLCAMAFQELEWHAINDVDFDDESDIPEVVPKSGTPVLNDMDPIWTSV